MLKENLNEVLRKHPFVGDLDDKYLQILVGCAKNVQYQEGDYLCHEGEAANLFFLIRSGKIVTEIHAATKGKEGIQTIGPGEVLGWSWLIFLIAGTSMAVRLLKFARWHSTGNAYAQNAIRIMISVMKCSNGLRDVLRKPPWEPHAFNYSMCMVHGKEYLN